MPEDDAVTLLIAVEGSVNADADVNVLAEFARPANAGATPGICMG